MVAASIRFPNLGIEIAHLGKSVSVFGIEIAYYGIIIGMAMIIGIALIMHEVDRTGQDKEMYYDMCIITLISAVIGCRIYYVAFEWSYYSQHLGEIINLRKGGLAIYGGIIGGLICMAVFSKIRKVKLSLLADTVVQGVVLGQIIGRWGNFCNREAFGGYTNSLLAMQIRVDEAAYTTTELIEKAVTIDGVQYIQVQPTFLYESLWNIGVLVLLMLYKRHKKFDGEVFFIYLLGYGTGRFVIEGFRTDQLLLPYIGLPVSRVLSAVLVILSLVVIIKKRDQLKYQPHATEEAEQETEVEIEQEVETEVEDSIDAKQKSEAEKTQGLEAAITKETKTQESASESNRT